jgi:hypothetical protein
VTAGAGWRVTASAGWRVTVNDRAALLRKYRLLASWRLARDEDDHSTEVGRANRAALKALAEEFPGALRELDLLGLPEIKRRIGRLTPPGLRRGQRAAKRAGQNWLSERAASRLTDNQDLKSDRWIAWILAYHSLMRAALVTKRTLGRARPSPTAVDQLAKTATTIAGVRLDESFVHDVARPPGGRLAIVVLRAVARRFDVSPVRVSATLFPPRRPAPYQLESPPP